jgi:hypothetical protein
MLERWMTPTRFLHNSYRLGDARPSAYKAFPVRASLALRDADADQRKAGITSFCVVCGVCVKGSIF